MLSVLQLHLCPFVQIENIDACLTFLAAKGINTQGLSAEGKLGSCMQLLLVAEWESRPVQSIPDQTSPGCITTVLSQPSQDTDHHNLHKTTEPNCLDKNLPVIYHF